jgi:hypothetical protein
MQNHASNSDPLPSRLRTPAATHQRLLAALRARRRGTFLVLVVGTLAMLSIIMIVYVAVGNADQRTSSGVARRNRSNEVVDSFASYIGQVIADDATATVPDPANSESFASNLDKLFTREAWDAPRTDWIRDSRILPTDTLKSENVFTPYGRGDDPWLASTTPTWINYLPQSNAPQNTDKTFTKRVDWLHISNVVPDGRFVNLSNLRNSFNAEPGIGGGSANIGGYRMSSALSLFKPDTGDFARGLLWDPNKDVMNSLTAEFPPAFFDSWQAGAFRPAQPPFKSAGAEIKPSDPFYPAYQWADADGDGFFDSRWFEMVDARISGQDFNTPSRWNTLIPSDPNYRWFFAARIVDLSSLVNINVATDLNANPNDETTLADEKTNKADAALKWKYGTQVLGRSPAEIDLRRLLTMRDFREVILGKPATNGTPAPINNADSLPISDVRADDNTVPENRVYSGGYSALRQPVAAALPNVQNYSAYSADPAQITALQGISNGTTLPNDINVGIGAYGALRAAVALGRSPGRFNDFSTGPLGLAHKPVGSQDLRWQSFVLNAGTLDRPIYRANGDGNYRTEAGFDFGLGFRTDALAELLTYRGTNDSSVTSTLETAVGGRAFSEFSKVPGLNTLPITVSPLRENRGLEIERANLAYGTGSAAGKPTEAALLKSYTDVRQYLTTISGARPLMSRLQTALNGDPWQTAATDLTTDDTTIELSENTSAPSFFQGFVTALMPGMPAGVPIPQAPNQPSTLDKAWDETSPESKVLRGLYYGHQGPLTALLTAAHMAANIDSGSKLPSDTTRGLPYTLVLSEDYQKDTNSTLPTDTSPTSPFVGAKQYFPAWWLGRQFNLARPENTRTNPTVMARIPTTGGTQVPVPAVNVYGTGDPHPLLVDVATFTVYRDVYVGDIPKMRPVDANTKADTEDPLGGPKPASVTINGNIEDLANADFLFRLLAIKVHNPYSIPIQLTSPVGSSGPFATTSGAQFSANTLRDFFYFKVGVGSVAKHYVPIEVEETEAGSVYTGEYTVKEVVIQPGETILFYALNRDSGWIVSSRFNPTDPGLSLGDIQDSTGFKAWLNKQLGPVSGTSYRRIQMLRVDDAAFRSTAVTPPAASATFANGILVAPFDAPAAEKDQTVQLYRAIRTDSLPATDDRSGTNSILNDQLCDRLRLGSQMNLDLRLRGGPPDLPMNKSYQITGLYVKPGTNVEAVPGGAFTYQSVTYPNSYNTRVTVNLATWVSRPADASIAEAVIPGAMPAWAVDPKDADPSTWYKYDVFPATAFSGSDWTPKQITSGELDASNAKPKFSAYTPRVWRDLDPVFENLGKRAGLSGKDIGQNLASRNFSELRREFASNGNGYRNYSVDSSPNKSQLRPVDLLGVMGVGPYETPVDASGNPITDLKKRWTTTAEALAIAMGYSKKPADRDTWKAAGNNYGPLDYYYFDRSKPTDLPPLYDGGYLKLNDYVCARIDSTNPAAPRYYPAATGAPIAGNILNAFRSMPDRFASLTVPTPGLVNINTAPSAVLRVLPMASPAEDFGSTSTNATGSQPKPTFWPAIGGNAEIAAQRTDIAAMIESYRDKIAVELRPGAKNPAATTITPTPHYSWFAPFVDRNKPSVLVGPAATYRIAPNDPDIGKPDNLPAQYKGSRYWTSGITGIREEAGFRGLGELLALRSVKVDTATLGGQADGRDQPINIDFLGNLDPATNTTGTNLLGIDNVLQLTTDASGNTTDAKPLQFANTNQDRLKILAALGGSVSVRSDMFAAWFIVRGYQRSDVEGLDGDQPMEPSIERRFLMIIDRSNVTKPGQKPRVVAMVELPL